MAAANESQGLKIAVAALICSYAEARVLVIYDEAVRESAQVRVDLATSLMAGVAVPDCRRPGGESDCAGGSGGRAGAGPGHRGGA